MEKWEMYMKIHQLKKQGFKVRRIARKLGISRTTVYKYLEKSPEEMSLWIASTKSRKKKLDPYEMIIHTWLTEHPDLTAPLFKFFMLLLLRKIYHVLFLIYICNFAYLRREYLGKGRRKNYSLLKNT